MRIILGLLRILPGGYTLFYFFLMLFIFKRTRFSKFFLYVKYPQNASREDKIFLHLCKLSPLWQGVLHNRGLCICFALSLQHYDEDNPGCTYRIAGIF